MAKIQTPKLQIFTPPTPPSIGPGDTSAVARLCSRFPGIAWLMTTVLRGMMMLFNVPTSTIQSYSAWSVAFQTGILHPPRGREREAFLRLGRLSRVRIVCTLMAAYVRSQSVRINENSEEIYPQQADDVEKIESKGDGRRHIHACRSPLRRARHVGAIRERGNALYGRDTVFTFAD